MTGTGTQADPYVPSSWAEFVTAIGNEGAYISVPENTTWDMNEIAPDGITSDINVASKIQVEGNNLTIKNLYLNGCTFSLRSHYGTAVMRNFKNINFLNLLIENGGKFITAVEDSNGYKSFTTFSNCKFSGIITDSTFACNLESYGDGRGKNIFEKCSLNFDFRGNSLLGYSSAGSTSNWGGALAATFNSCNIKLSGSSTNNDSSASSANSVRKSNAVAFNNSLISGTNPFNWLYVSLYGNYANDPSTYSIFDLICQSGQTIRNSGTVKITQCLINSDTLNSASVISEITQVTSSQLRDASYLSSIGFPIAT